MRQRCLAYRWWEERHNVAAKKASRHIADVNWKELFFHRHKVELITLRFLNEIIEDPMNHIVKFNKVVDFGYDAKDCLKEQAEVSDTDVDDPLARRYHATAAIRYIHRRRALEIWNRVRDYDDVPLEVALLALELFVLNSASPDVQEIVQDLDDLARTFLSATPDFSDSNTSEKSMKLILWMWDQGFTGAPHDRYHAFKNVFIGITIRCNRTAIPLTLVAIFCALARRVGLKAYPCGYPGRVLAIVEDQDAMDYRYYDIFCGPGTDPRNDRATLLEGLPSDLLGPASTSLMVVRAAKNIVNTLQLPDEIRERLNEEYTEICEHSTFYAALTAMVVLRSGFGPVSVMVVQHMTHQIPAGFPMDVRFLEEELLPLIIEPDSRRLLENVCGALRTEDSTPRTVSRRNCPENKRVLHRVGTIFKHRRYPYSGVIFGWTNTCQPFNGEDWIAQMNVDTLPRGRNQPFYHVLVDDGSVRYVAEENIEPIKPTSIAKLAPMAGKYFKRFDPGIGQFVSNVKTEFPDD